MGIEEHIGDYGVAIALIIGAVLIVQSVMGGMIRIMAMWREAAKERHATDQRREDIEAKQLLALDAIVARLSLVDTGQHELRTMVDGARREHQVLISTIANEDYGLAVLARKIDDLPIAVRAGLVDEFERVGESLSALRGRLDVAITDWAQWGAKLAALMASDGKKPVTPAPGALTASVEKARQQIVEADAVIARKTGDHAPAGEQTSGTSASE